jgi:hypothetical protein
MTDTGFHELEAKLGWRIDEDISLREGQEGSVPCSSVPGIV